MATEAIRLPNIQLHSIYEGKFKDRAPTIRAAGKLTSTGESVELCMKPKDDRPDSPEIVRRFRDTFRPDTAKKTIFYGQAHDPHRKWAEDMRHGVNTHPSDTVGLLVNPNPKTLFHQKKIDWKEKHYASHVRAPLGMSHDQRPGLPENLDPVKFTFGKQTYFDVSIKELVNPDKTYAQVEAESAVAHDQYVKSHKDYYVGEKVHRSYTLPEFNPSSRYGIPTEHDNMGKMVRKTFQWNNELKKGHPARIVSKRVDDFREKFQPQLGQVLDPIKDTLNVGPDHAFGALLKPDEYGVGDLLHNRIPRNYLRGRDQQRGLVAAMRQQLKNLNYHNFPDLIHAFHFYDKEGKGKIDINDLREVCIKYSLPIDDWLLEQVFDYCDVNRNGQIDYTEFANFLNWKESLPPGFAEVPYVERPKPFVNPKSVGRTFEMMPQYSKVRRSHSADIYQRHLQKQVDKAIGDHHTSAGMINAVVGPTGLDTSNFRTYGIPTIRSDIAPPCIRRVNDRQNYGDESEAYGLTNPSLYSQFGVYEKDLLIPRTKEEIGEIFGNIGVLMSGDTLETLYKTVAATHPKGHVSVESFRCALDDVQAAKIVAGEHPLAF